MQTATLPVTDLRADLEAVLAEQEEHAVYPRVEVDFSQPCTHGRITRRLNPEAPWRVCDLAELLQALELRRKWIAAAAADNFNGGIWFPAWHDVLWELCRLRVENPGRPVAYCVGGSNGSAKTMFAAAVLVRAMMHTRHKLFWSITMDEPNSETVQQRAVYFWLPNEYKTTGGGIKGSARGKLKFNDSGGFTDNRFSLYHGASHEFRFWSKDIQTLEGPRPYAVWSDEEIPLEWMEGVKRRLLTHSEPTKKLTPQWVALLARKAKDPGLPFPLEKLGELMMGVHLITYTAKNGYTDTVRSFVEGAKVMREIEADPELLPRRDPQGNVLGGEMLPSLLYCHDKSMRMSFLYAWQNPLGGNWEGMRADARHMSRAKKLWWCYGVAERLSGTPFANFNVQVHVRPLLWLPRRGTWYHVVDPVASGGKCWTMIWAKVAAEAQGYIWPGDIVIVHEYPQCDDFMPGLGRPDPWAIPGGKHGLGVPGTIQHAWSGGYQGRAEEIRRIERKLGRWEAEANAAPWNDNTTIVVPHWNRLMDCRPLNTETEGNTETKTIAEWMMDFDLYFEPTGKDSGAASDDLTIGGGEQTLNNFLDYNREAAVITGRGWMEIDPARGRGPRMWILEHCTNTIAGLQNYPGQANGGRRSTWKDVVDPLRYLAIANPEHAPPRPLQSIGGVRKLF